MQLSPNFSLAELTVTNTGLPNIPNADETAHLKALAQNLLEKVRTILGNHPIHVNSSFRSESVNNAVGGVSNSAHRLGLAADIVCPAYGPPRAVAQALDKAAREGHLEFDQLILEQLPNPTWVHVGYRLAQLSDRPRMQRLTKQADGSYEDGIH